MAVSPRLSRQTAKTNDQLEVRVSRWTRAKQQGLRKWIKAQDIALSSEKIDILFPLERTPPSGAVKLRTRTKLGTAPRLQYATIVVSKADKELRDWILSQYPVGGRKGRLAVNDPNRKPLWSLRARHANEIEENNLAISRHHDVDSGVSSGPNIGTQKTRLPDTPPQMWPDRPPGRRRADEADLLVKFINQVYGPYIAEHGDSLRSYIYQHDKRLYKAIDNAARKGEIPEGLRQLSTRTSRLLKRLETAEANGFEGMTELARARAEVHLRFLRKPKAP